MKVAAVVAFFVLWSCLLGAFFVHNSKIVAARESRNSGPLGRATGVADPYPLHRQYQVLGSGLLLQDGRRLRMRGARSCAVEYGEHLRFIAGVGALGVYQQTYKNFPIPKGEVSAIWCDHHGSAPALHVLLYGGREYYLSCRSEPWSLLQILSTEGYPVIAAQADGYLS